MITKHHNRRGEYCSFDDERHEYWSGTNTDQYSRLNDQMISVTSLIGQFYKVSPWYGKDTADDIEFGNRVHSVASSAIRNEKPSVSASDERERKTFSAVWKYATRLRDGNSVTMNEDVVFSSYAAVAGKVDLVFTCNGKTYLCDWKTGDIMMPAKSKFIAPFNHLVADPMTIYSLQCSMYQVLMDMGGYGEGTAFAPARLLWVHDGEDGNPCVDAVPVRDLRREAAMMIAMRGYTPYYAEWSKTRAF